MSNHLNTATDLDSLPSGAVIHCVNMPDLAWIKKGHLFANYSNWPEAPTTTAVVLKVATEVMRGTAAFENHPAYV